MDAKKEAKLEIADEAYDLGQRLKSRREELALSLQEVESSIAIKTVVLDAIERGAGDEVIHAAYARGFTRSYADFLGIDPASLHKEYPGFFAHLPGQVFEFGIGTLEVRSTLPTGVGLSLGWWIFLVMSGLVMALFVATLLGWLG